MSMSETLELVSENRSFGGRHQRYRHYSRALDCDMIFAVYLPPQAEDSRVPLLWWLSGLTCNDENFMQKAGAQRLAAELGVAIICPDTSPRGTNVPGEHDSFDLGSGAGFYVNATQAPWKAHYRMYDYIVEELPSVVRLHFPVNGRESISGHSMGGHGALMLALRHPGRFRSVSAFSPVVNPMECPWGQNAFRHYLGEDKSRWRPYDACELVANGASRQRLFIDQGEADNFLDEQLKPGHLEAVCEAHDHPLTLRRQPGYDHSYFFIASFIEDHLRYHAEHLYK
ncbi:S-formylglutathione hydrolase [Vreelandella jeotgali]|uniref:S-formylglutathione hydrolase n=1 Tax=Vreelandella jeotgali TaxID=553386 RepID=UPI0003450E1B|nr:S-formylglutathione hydrolase [Halomonas jeotgali]